MTTASTLLSWVLATAPEPPPPPETVEFAQSDDSVQLTARDADGDVAAEVFLWTDTDGNIRLDATWPDGLYLSVISDGEDATVHSEDGAEVEARLLELDAALQEPAAAPQWLECAGSVVLAGAACIPPLGPFKFAACVGAAGFAACACTETATDGENSCWD
jgi:hypothetical protein